MWNLYKILKRDGQEDYLIQEAIKILDTISTESFQKSLNIMYPNKSPKTSVLAALWFIEGIKNCGFFSFVGFIKGINGSR